MCEFGYEIHSIGFKYVQRRDSRNKWNFYAGCVSTALNEDQKVGNIEDRSKFNKSQSELILTRGETESLSQSPDKQCESPLAIQNKKKIKLLFQEL